MAYLNANIPADVRTDQEGIPYMTLKNIMGEAGRLYCIWQWHRLQAAPYCFMQLWKMVLSSIVYRLVPSYKEVLMSKKFLGLRLDELELWNLCFSYHPSMSLLSISLDGQSRKIHRKRQKMASGYLIFLLLTGLTQRVIY